MDEFPMDYMSLARFHEQHPTLHATLHPSIHSIRWEMRFRATNGLLEDGVVMERYADPNSPRPQLLISPSRYFAWLRGRVKEVDIEALLPWNLTPGVVAERYVAYPAP